MFSHLRLSLLVGVVLMRMMTAAAASEMAEFLKRQAQFVNEADRPVLLVSRGAVIAWIYDPYHHLPGNFASYFDRGDARLIVVPPGTAMMAFPMRLQCPNSWIEIWKKSCPPAPGTDRGRDGRYQLVLTETGFWGVLDRQLPTSFLDEQDLMPMAKAEEDENAKFFIAIKQVGKVADGEGADVSYLYFDRGQPLRGADASCRKTRPNWDCVNLDVRPYPPTLKKVPTFEKTKDQLAKLANQNHANPVDTKTALQVPDDQVRPLRIFRPIVPEYAMDDWLNHRQAGYEAILTHGAFHSLQVVKANSNYARCYTKFFSRNELTEKFEGVGKAELRGGLKTPLVSADVETAIEAAATRAAGSGMKAKLTLPIDVNLTRVDLTDENEEHLVFYAGLAKTCGSGETVATLMVSDLPPEVEMNATFLVDNFWALAEQIIGAGQDTGRIDAAKAELGKALDSMSAIKPGGNPLDPKNGTVTFKCLSQALEFQQIAEQMMSLLSASEVEAAIGIESSRANGSGADKFFKDDACNKPAP